MKPPVDPDLVGIALAAPRSPASPYGQAALDRRASRPPCEPHCHADTLNPSSGGTFWCSACDRFTSDEIALAWIREVYPERFQQEHIEALIRGLR